MIGRKIRIESASDFLEQMVLPDREDFVRNPTDLRYAFHLASSLFHLRDWVYEQYGEIKGWSSKGILQEFLQSRCNDFALIRDIANSAKHLNVKNPSIPATGVIGASQTLTTLTPNSIVTPLHTARNYVDDSGSAIVVEVPGNPAVMFCVIADSVLDMWNALFLAEGWR